MVGSLMIFQVSEAFCLDVLIMRLMTESEKRSNLLS